MKNTIRFGLAAGLAGALALLGSAQAQQDTTRGSAGSGTGAGDSGAMAPGTGGNSHGSSAVDSPSSETGSRSGTATSDSASGGGGASASSSDTATGAPSAGKKVDKKLQDDLEKIHAANQAELQMAQLGAQNAQSEQVKDFAQKMQSDHQQMDQQLTQQAQTMGVSLEGKTFQKETQSAQKGLQKLQSKTGTDFDKAFMSQMVKDHEKDLKAVKGAAKDAQKGNQPELASALQDAQTRIKGHLDHAKQLQKAVSKGGASAAAGSSSTSGTGSSSDMSGTGSSSPHSGSRGDTGGPTPGGGDRGTGPSSGPTTTPGGGEKGTSSDTGKQ